MILRENTKAQSTIEFTFGVIVIMFIIYGMVQVFRWAGLDLAQRRWAQDAAIVNLDTSTGDPASELYPGNAISEPMAAVYHGTITSGNVIP